MAVMNFLRNLLVTAILLTTAAFAQQTPQQVFDNAYWASQPPAVQTLRGHYNDYDTVAALATQGYLIDVPVMLYGWDPYIVMQARLAEGETWTPSALMHPLGCIGTGCYALPGLNPLPEQMPYPTSPIPAGGLKVSIDPADFPAYVAPVK
jgi:hypothetical protein